MREAVVVSFADQALAQRVEDAWAYLGIENARAQARAEPEIGGDGVPGRRRLRGVHGGGLAAVAGAGGGPVRAGGQSGDRADGEPSTAKRRAPIHLEVASLAECVAAGALEPSRLPRAGRADAHPGAADRGGRVVRGDGWPDSEKSGPRTGRGGGPGRPGPAGTRWRPGPSRCSAASSRARRSCPARLWKAPRDGLAPDGELLAGPGRRPDRRGRCPGDAQPAGLDLRRRHPARVPQPGHANGAAPRPARPAPAAPAATWPSSAPSPAAARSATPSARGFSVVYARTLMGRE